ncbi:MAG: acyl carrier protein [Flavobacteriales bacterium]|nr:acyl carrier protein [Flavobacteriales bacterium]
MEEKINQILADTLKVPMEKTTEDLTMDDVNNWDSLTHMNLIVAIEDAFGIELSGDDIAEMISFNAIRSTVAKYL